MKTIRLLVTLLLGLSIVFGCFSCVVFSKEPPRRNGWIILQRQPIQTKQHLHIKHHKQHRVHHYRGKY